MGWGHLAGRRPKGDRLWQKVCPFLNQRACLLRLITEPSCFSKTLFSQKDRRKEKSGSDLAQAGAELLHTHKVSSLLWVHHVNGVSQGTGDSA